MTDKKREPLPDLWVRLRDCCVLDDGPLATVFREKNPEGFNRYIPASRLEELRWWLENSAIGAVGEDLIDRADILAELDRLLISANESTISNMKQES